MSLISLSVIFQGGLYLDFYNLKHHINSAKKRKKNLPSKQTSDTFIHAIQSRSRTLPFFKIRHRPPILVFTPKNSTTALPASPRAIFPLHLPFFHLPPSETFRIHRVHIQRQHEPQLNSTQQSVASKAQVVKIATVAVTYQDFFGDFFLQAGFRCCRNCNCDTHHFFLFFSFLFFCFTCAMQCTR